ncbi:hypothetical protein [Haloplanus salilacus]|uniref:hypothetical protein n=1 Tax=Haloplanus salilacus TaxID=2949994 RepID=UPI0030CAC231
MDETFIEILSDGGDTRQLQDLNSCGTLGVSLPRDDLEQLGAEKGDHVAIDFDEDEEKFEICVL